MAKKLLAVLVFHLVTLLIINKDSWKAVFPIAVSILSKFISAYDVLRMCFTKLTSIVAVLNFLTRTTQ